MSEDFKRQIRYIVLKNNDVSRALDADQHRELLALCAAVSEHREVEGKQPMQCVVVESDWSIYEQVWKLVELEAQGIAPDDRISTLERELAEVKARGERLRAAIAPMVSALRKHRFCGDQYPEEGWLEVDVALANYAALQQSA